MIIKFINRLDKAEIALLDEVEKQHASADIALCDGNDKTQVSLGHAALGLLVALAHPRCKLYLLVGGEKRNLAYLLEIHTNGIIGGEVGVCDYLGLGLDYLLLGDLLYLL